MLRMVLSALETQLVHTGLKLGPEPVDVGFTLMNMEKQIVYALLMRFGFFDKVFLEILDDFLDHFRHLITLPFP